MLIQQLIRTDPERVQLIVKNVDGSGSITTGQGVALVSALLSFDGISASKNLAAQAGTFVGIAQQDIPINGFGLVTAWGYVASVEVSCVGTSLTVTVGDVLKPGAIGGRFFSGLASEAVSTLLYRYVINGSTITISSPITYVVGFVKAL